jgi:hypothetical protein
MDPRGQFFYLSSAFSSSGIKLSLPENEMKRNTRNIEKICKTLGISPAPEGMVVVYGDEEGEYLLRVFGLALVTDGEFEHIRPIVDGGGILDAGEIENVLGYDILKFGETEEQLLEKWAEKNDHRKKNLND